MNSQVQIIDSDAGAMYIPGFEAAVIFEKKKEKSPVDKATDTKLHALWGDDNLHPQSLVEAAESNDLIPMIIDFKARALYSGGLVYGIEEIDENGISKFKRVIDPEVEIWLKKIKANIYIKEAAEDLYYFNNIFARITLNAKMQIVGIVCEDACFSRLSKQSPDGSIKTAYINANWDNGGTAENSIIYPTLDWYGDMVEQINTAKKLSYIIPLRYQSKGRVYYDRAPWEGIIDSGWLEIAKAVPAFKKALMQNQISIKYLIRIPDYWWKWKFKDWDSWDDKTRIEKQKTELSNFISFMKGTDNAGNVFMTTFKYDATMKVEYPGWSIEELKNDTKTGAYIEDSQEADFHIIRAFGVDPTLVGVGPGKGHTAGSGSDKRVAFNQHVLLTKSEQDRILEPFNLASELNGFDARLGGSAGKLTWMMQNYFIATLDQVTNEKRM